MSLPPTFRSCPLIIVLLQFVTGGVQAQVDTPVPEGQYDVLKQQMYDDYTNRLNNVVLRDPVQWALDARWMMQGGDLATRYPGQDIEPARDEFVATFRTMLTHLADESRGQATAALDTLSAFPNPNEYESALLALGDITLVPGDADPESFFRKLQAFNSHSTTDSGVPLFPEEVRIPYLQVAFMVATQLKYYGEALVFYETLRGMQDRSHARNLEPQYLQIKTLAEDDSTYGIETLLGESGTWDLVLLKKNFYLDEVTGSIQAFELICDSLKSRLQVEVLLSYAVPEGQENCQVRITGDGGTRFALVQY